MKTILRRLFSSSVACLMLVWLVLLAPMAHAASPIVIDIGSGTLRAGLFPVSRKWTIWVKKLRGTFC